MTQTLIINKAYSSDQRYNLKEGAGSDAIHTTAQYAYAVCHLQSDKTITGIGLAFTLGKGNDLVCKAINHMAAKLEGRDINEIMANFGAEYKAMADDPDFRWLGPHKGVIHLALAAIVNACFDLWAKSKQVPLWKLLIDLTPQSIIDLMDFSYFEEVLTKKEALSILTNAEATSSNREGMLKTGYRGYDTSIGWFNYGDSKVKENVKKAIDNGFTAMKLKVGSSDSERDIRRAKLVRATGGDNITIMLDANQQWNLPKAIKVCKELSEINPYWIEEPTHPDDVFAHVELSRQIAPMKLALGEHVPNKIVFKNFLQSECVSFNQADVVRVGGVSEYLIISLLSKKFKVPMVPHVGDMGQIHQHLVLFNHLAVGHENLFLEYIPHLKDYFKHPAQVKDGFYKVPQEPGMSSDLIKY